MTTFSAVAKQALERNRTCTDCTFGASCGGKCAANQWPSYCGTTNIITGNTCALGVSWCCNDLGKICPPGSPSAGCAICPSLDNALLDRSWANVNPDGRVRCIYDATKIKTKTALNDYNIAFLGSGNPDREANQQAYNQFVLPNFCQQPENVASQDCATFCANPDNKPFCDTAMRSYCAQKEHEDEDICSCINSNGIPRPSCFDLKCTQKGYRTADMVRDSQNCGDPLFCLQIVNCVKNGSCNVSENTFNIHCSKSGVPYPNGNGNGGGKPNLPLIIGISVGVLVLIGVIVGISVGASKRKHKEMAK